jgi:tetratricopeptide (TPR) repeat protein
MNTQRLTLIHVASPLRRRRAVRFLAMCFAGEPSFALAESTSREMINVRDMLSGALEVTALLAAFALLIAIIRWSFCKRGGMTILPFEIGAGDARYSGRALADAMASELTRIELIRTLSTHTTNTKIKNVIEAKKSSDERVRVTPTVDRATTIPAIQLMTNAGATIPDIAVELGGTKFSLGNVLLGVKQLWTNREPELVIGGSLQVFGSNARLIGRLERYGSRNASGGGRRSACLVREAVATVEAEHEIPNLVRELAFQFYFELLDEDTRETQTWQGLKAYTEALASYKNHSVSKSADDLDHATKQMFSALGAEPNNRTFFDFLYRLGDEHFSLGDYDQAISLYLRALRLKTYAEEEDARGIDRSQSADAFNALGMCYALQGDLPHAEVAFRRSLKANNRASSAYINLARLYKVEEREADLQDLLDAPPPGFLEKLTAAEAGAWYEELGREKEALAALVGSKEPDAQLQLTRTLANLGKWDQAIEVCRRLIAGAEASSLPTGDLLNELGTLLADQNLPGEASAAYLQSIARDPENAAPHNNLALIYKQQKEWAKARLEFQRALALNPELSLAHMNLVALYEERGIPQLAAAQLERLVRLDSSDQAARYKLGVIYDDLGRTDDAIIQMEQAAPLDPTNSDVLDYLAYLYTKTGRLEEAITQINKVIENNPNNLRAFAFLASLYRRLGRDKEADAQVAATLSRKAQLQTDSDSPLFSDVYQEACFEALCGNSQAALNCLRAALDAGLRTEEFVRHDADFFLIREDPGFKALLLEKSRPAPTEDCLPT